MSILDELLVPKADAGSSYRMATVLSIDPIRILLDGDAVPIDFTPRTLVELLPYDRVIVLFNNRQVTILGVLGGVPRVPVATVQIWAGGKVLRWNLTGTHPSTLMGDTQYTNNFSWEDEVWSKYYSPAGGGTARAPLLESYLEDGEEYIIRAKLGNPGASDLTVQIDWCDTTPFETVIPAGEIRIVHTPPMSRATYDATYSFVDFKLVNTGTLLLTEFLVDRADRYDTDDPFFNGDTPDTVNTTYRWINTPWASPSVTHVRAPFGWLACDGAEYSKISYSALYEELGDYYGSTETTFNVPDLRGRVPYGRSFIDSTFSTLGGVGGSKTHTLTIAEMPAHTHDAPTFNGNTGSLEVPTSAGGGGYDYIGGAPTSTKGGGAAHNNMPPFMVMNYIIKY